MAKGRGVRGEAEEAGPCHITHSILQVIEDFVFMTWETTTVSIKTTTWAETAVLAKTW